MRRVFSVLGLAALCGLVSSKLHNEVLCGQYQNYTSPSGQYTFSTNQWGADGSGNECVTISPDGTEFNSTWQWGNNPLSVHSFPNIRLNSAILPVQLSNLSALNIAASWSMMPSSPSDGLLADIGAAADVVVDMFADPDSTIATSTTLPMYEFMVWLAAFDGKKPIGFSSSIANPPTLSLNSTTFSLYMGPNSNGQFVYSWLAATNVDDLDEDISPLIHYLWRHNYIPESSYLGVVQFGSETFHSDANVTFSTTGFNMNVSSGTPKPASSSTQLLPSLGLVVIATIFSLAISTQ